jgi:hypothetical protein
VVNTAILTAIVEGSNIEKMAVVSYTTQIIGEVNKGAKTYLPVLLKYKTDGPIPTPTNTPIAKTILKVVSQRSQPIITTRGQPIVFFIEVGHDTGSNTPPDSFEVKADLLAGGIPEPIFKPTQATNIGDTNDNGKLDIGEIWKYQFTYNTTCDTHNPLASNITIAWQLNGVNSQTTPVHTLEVQVQSEYYEGFDNVNRPWALGSLTRGTYSIGTSQYKIAPYPDKTGYSASPFGSFNQPIVRVKAKWENSGNWYGLFFGLQRSSTDVELNNGVQSFYRFLVDSNNQKFSLQKFDFATDSSNFQTVIDWTLSSSINAGTTLNDLKVECTGTTITLFVNDTLLQSVAGQCSGELGVMANGTGASALFDSFEICAASSSRRNIFSDIGGNMPGN